jgi:hypothetical protein
MYDKFEKKNIMGKVCVGLAGRLQRKQETRNKTKPKTELSSILDRNNVGLYTRHLS